MAGGRGEGMVCIYKQEGIYASHFSLCNLMRALPTVWIFKRECAQVCSCFCKKCFNFQLGEISFKTSYDASIS